MVWARRLERGEASFQLRERVLSGEHFEFRRGAGGAEQGSGRRREERQGR
jgi:hypothetical protein